MEPYDAQCFDWAVQRTQHGGSNSSKSNTVTRPAKIGLFGEERGITKDIQPNQLPTYLENIEIWSLLSDGVINGIRFTYYVHNRGRQNMSWGKHPGIPHQIQIDVRASEYVKNIEGNVGYGPDGNRGITSLKIITSRGTVYGPYGDRTKGYPFSVPLVNSGIVAFFASADSYLNALGFYVQPIDVIKGISQQGSIPVMKIGLIGWKRAKTNKDILQNQLPEKLEKIEIWSSHDGESTGAVINGICFTYVATNGRRWTVPSKRERAWGTATGNYHEIEINTAEREYVNNINGRVGRAPDGAEGITYLAINTSSGQIHGFGDPRNGDPFDMPLANSGIFAFFASADSYIDALGFYVQPYP